MSRTLAPEEGAARVGLPQTGPSPARQRVILLGILLGGLLIRLPVLSEPLETDQTQIAVMGEGILRGQVPYRDLWDHKPPGVFFAATAAIAAMGPADRSLYLADIAMALATAVVLFFLLRRVAGPGAGLWAAGLYTLLSNGIAYNLSSGIRLATFAFRFTAESLMVLPIAAALLCALRGREGRGTLWWGGAGLCLGWATLLKLLPALYLLPLGLLLWGGPRRRRAAAFLLGGFAVPLALAAAYFAARGALGDLYESVILYNALYRAIGRSGFLPAARRIAVELGVPGLLAAGVSVGILLRDRRPASLLLVAWGGLWLLILGIQRKFYGYHFLPLVTPIAALASVALVALWRSGGAAGRWVARGAVGATLALFTTTNAAYYLQAGALWTGRLPAEEYYASYDDYPHHYSYPAYRAVASYIEGRTRPGEPIFAVGRGESAVYFYSHRPPASRFLFTGLLFMREGKGMTLVQRWYQELLTDLHAHPPHYIVLGRPLAEFADFPEFVDLLHSGYTLAQSFPDERFVFARKGRGGSP